MRNDKKFSEPQPPFLDSEGAAQKLQELGLQCNPNQVRRWFDTKQQTVPWFKALDGKRRIAANTLEECLKQPQREAIRRASRGRRCSTCGRRVED